MKQLSNLSNSNFIFDQYREHNNNGVLTLTDSIHILLPILTRVPKECTAILSESETLFESESGSVNAIKR